MIICLYCNKPAELVEGLTIYPHRPDLNDRKFYYCKPCGAYVGTHRSTGMPLGALANYETREARKKAHAAFDPIWRELKMCSRKRAYKRLSKAMGLPEEKTHIGMFTAGQCEKVVEFSKELGRME